MLQQLDALSRLAAIAGRLTYPPASAEIDSATGLVARIRGLEKALRLQARVSWALRLIEALRARLVAELKDLDNGKPPAQPLQACMGAGEFEASTASPAFGPADGAERPEHAERRERLERERFGFEPRRAEAEIAEILRMPTAEIIALICRELGLSDDWPRQAEEAWVRELAGPDGSEPHCLPVFQPAPGASRIAAAPS